MRKKYIKIVAGICVIALIGTSVYFYMNKNNGTSSVVYKEVQVMYGNITAGVTESGSATVGASTQDYDLDFSNLSVSSGTSGSNTTTSTNSSNQAGGNNPSSAGSSGSSSSASTSSIDSTLVVDEVYMTEGKSIAKGDAILKLTDESIAAVSTELNTMESEAETSLKTAKLSDQETLLEAKYQYDSYITAGKQAEATYKNTLEQLQNKIDLLNAQIDEINAEIEQESDSKKLEQFNSQLEQYQSQLEEAESNQTSKSTEAKKTYESALLYYNNATDIYNQQIASVGDDTEEAQETLDDIQELQKSFEEFVGEGTIYADFDGTITTVNYAAGDSLDTSLALAEYADSTSMTISVDVTEDDISAVSIGDKVNISFLAYTDDTYQGTVTEIGSSTATSSTVSYPVTVTIDTAPDKILTGMTANVTFITKEVDNVLYVSNKAIINDGTNSYVQVKEESGSSQNIEVSTGFSDGVYVEITGDVKEGDTVLIESKVSN